MARTTGAGGFRATASLFSGEKQRTAQWIVAEPALASEGSSAARSIAWYTSAEGEIVPPPQASPDQQREILCWLENALQSAFAGCSDPDIGPLLQRALIVATLEDILLVGGQVVLTNWGLAPPSVVDREDGLRQHFAATLGRYVSLPWLMATPPGDDRAPDLCRSPRLHRLIGHHRFRQRRKRPQHPRRR